MFTLSTRSPYHAVELAEFSFLSRDAFSSVVVGNIEVWKYYLLALIHLSKSHQSPRLVTSSSSSSSSSLSPTLSSLSSASTSFPSRIATPSFSTALNIFQQRQHHHEDQHSSASVSSSAIEFDAVARLGVALGSTSFHRKLFDLRFTADLLDALHGASASLTSSTPTSTSTSTCVSVDVLMFELLEWLVVDLDSFINAHTWQGLLSLSLENQKERERKDGVGDVNRVLQHVVDVGHRLTQERSLGEDVVMEGEREKDGESMQSRIDITLMHLTRHFTPTSSVSAANDSTSV